MTQFVEPAVIACPSCEARLLQKRLASINDYGAVYWSDNYADILFLNSVSSLVCCPTCEGMFWAEDAERLGIMPNRPASLNWSGPRRLLAKWTEDYQSVLAAEAAWKAKPEDWEWTTALDRPRGRELLWALEHGIGSTIARETHIRMRLWWAGNNPHRGYKRRSPMSAMQTSQNMSCLLALKRTLPTDKRDYLLEGELLREMGCFAEAVSVLEEQVTERATRADIILAKAKEGNSRVCEVGRSQFSF